MSFLDPVFNFAKSTLASGITDSATSLSVSTGEGSLFPDPSTDGAFDAVIFNETDYIGVYDDPDVEVVRVTSISTDTFTITRAQQGTSASAHNTGGKTYGIFIPNMSSGFRDAIEAHLQGKKGSDIASATTTDIGAATGMYVDITGTTTITSFGTADAGTKRIIQFDGALTLTHNATSLILPSQSDILTAAGDTAVMVSLGSGNWKCVVYTKADGTPVDLPLIFINEQTGTSYTLVLADKSKLVDCANASAITLTVPPNSSVAFPTGSKIAVRQSGAGAITLTPGSGVTLQSQDSALTTNGQYAMCVLIKVDTDTWAVEGNVVA